MKCRKSVSIVMIVSCLIAFSFPSIISAHAYIVKSSPSENEIVKKSPHQVTIQFNGTLQSENHSIEVFDENGKRVDKKNGRINPNNSTILESGLKQNLSNGTYRIKWRVVSNDGHPVQGAIAFQVGQGSKNLDKSIVNQESTGYTPKMDLIMIRWFQYFSNACFVGALFCFLVIIPKDLIQNRWVKKVFKRIVKLSFLLLFFNILLSLPSMATIESDTTWSNALNITTLKDIITNTVFGKMWLVQMDVLFLLSICTYLISVRNNPIFHWISLILGITLLFTKALTSHAASLTNPPLTVGIDFLHLLSASIWIGCLVVLTVCLPLSGLTETKDQYLEMIRRFSKWGIMVVVVLSTTGIFGSLSYIPNLNSLFNTEYGKVLLGKGILLGTMLILAAMNFLNGRRKSAKGISSSIWGELVTGLIVLVLSVILTNLPTAMASPGPIKETNSLSNGNKITFKVAPNIIGENTFEIFLKDSYGQPIKDIEQVTLTFSSLELDMGVDTKTLNKINVGRFKTQGLNFNMAGHWNVNVHVLTKDLENLDTNFKVVVGSH